MSFLEPYKPIDPPEIRHPKERLAEHDFYVNIGVPQPEVAVLEMLVDWLRKQPPITVVSIQFSYLRETDEEPAILEASLIMGSPLDIG